LLSSKLKLLNTNEKFCVQPLVLVVAKKVIMLILHKFDFVGNFPLIFSTRSKKKIDTSNHKSKVYKDRIRVSELIRELSWKRPTKWRDWPGQIILPLMVLVKN